ncbi:replication initiation protein [Holzapfeliella sp. JNUCC 80]
MSVGGEKNKAYTLTNALLNNMIDLSNDLEGLKMAENEITRYDIELNTIPLGKLKPAEMNLFFSIVTKMKERGDEKVKFYFSELKELSDFKSPHSDRFLKVVRNTYKKLLELNFGRTSKNGLIEEHFIMFSEFTINSEEAEPFVEIKIYDKAIPLLNDLTSWVRYSLHEFNSIKSSYAKTLFRLLKQYRTTGYFRIKKEDFNELMNIPKSYRQTDINRYALKPSMEQLAPFFKNLKMEKEFIKKQGKPLKGYIFTFTPEPKNKDDFQEKKKQFKKPKKEIATDWSPKQSKAKVDNRSLDDILGQIDETKEKVKS